MQSSFTQCFETIAVVTARRVPELDVRLLQTIFVEVVELFERQGEVVNSVCSTSLQEQS